MKSDRQDQNDVAFGSAANVAANVAANNSIFFNRSYKKDEQCRIFFQLRDIFTKRSIFKNIIQPTDILDIIWQLISNTFLST